MAGGLKTEEWEGDIEKEIELNEANALHDHYERRCKVLSDVAMHWKEQTRLLYEKYSIALGVLKREHEKYLDESSDEIKKLRLDYERDLGIAKAKHLEVTSSSIAQDIDALKGENKKLEDKNAHLSKKIAKLRISVKRHTLDHN